MSPREALHQQIDALAEEDLHIAERLLAGLSVTADPILRALALAPVDDEPETPEERQAVEEALRDIREGRTVLHEEARRRLGVEHDPTRQG